jgi:dephospho-CoA kinase
MIYGLTGGIATGKSTVAKMFCRFGATVLDADKVSREVVESGTVGSDKIRERFGNDFFASDGQLQRDKLAAIIFADPVAREQLNLILHPLIMEDMQRQTVLIQNTGNRNPIIWDIPLLFEENLTHYVQKVIVVYVPEKVQLTRLIKRNNLSQTVAEMRIQTQLPIEGKRKLADYLIDNSGTVQQTERQVVAIWNHLT